MTSQQITENLNKMHEIALHASYKAQAAISAYDACKAIDKDIEMTGAVSVEAVDLVRAAIAEAEKETA